MAWNINDPFPASAMGKYLGPAVWQHHGNARLSMELIAPIALGMAAAAVQDLYDVARPNMAPSAVSLFVKVIAGSGEGKDAAAAPWVRPFYDFQAEADKEFEQHRLSFELDLQTWKVAEKLLLSALEQCLREGGSPADVRQQLAAHLVHRPHPPRAPLVIYDDATVSSMKNSLCERWRSGILFSMDADDLFNGRLGAEYAFWNAGWNGDPIFSDRVAEGRRSVHDPRIGMVVGIQPVPYRRYLKSRGADAHDSGFTARYLITVPPSTKGFRFIGAWQVSTDAIDACAVRFRELLEEGAARTRAGLPRAVLRFSPAAAEKFVALYNRLQALMAPGQPFSEISGQAAKAAENVARVAAVLHVLDGLDGDISEDTLERATIIVEWFTNQFLTVFGADGGKPSVDGDASSIEHALWRARSRGHAPILRSELKYWCPPDVHGSRFDRGLHLLVACGRACLFSHKGKTYVALPQDWAPPAQPTRGSTSLSCLKRSAAPCLSGQPRLLTGSGVFGSDVQHVPEGAVGHAPGVAVAGVNAGRLWVAAGDDPHVRL